MSPFCHGCFYPILLILLGNNTCIRARMSLKVGHLGLLTTDLAAIKRKKLCLGRYLSDVFNFGDIKKMHSILHEFEFRSVWITDYGVNCQ